MPSDSIGLLALLLFVAAASGWAIARWTRPSHPRRERLSGDYFSGLSFMLREQPDKALEVFSRLLEVDQDTVEIHFALGALFRRRGEVDRAIRIHQNIIARPNLERNQRVEALFALGEDYMRAGLFDRAEQIFIDLAEAETQREMALSRLVRIYEQQKDWEQAVAARTRLGRESAVDQGQYIAQYHCEMAQEAMERGDRSAARQALRRARIADRNGIRGMLMRADLALTDGEAGTALRLLTRAVGIDRSFVFETLPRVESSGETLGRDAVEQALAGLLARDPDLLPLLGFAVLYTGLAEGATRRQALLAFLNGNGALEHVMKALGFASQSLTQADLCDKVAASMRSLAQSVPLYHCLECGYSSNRLYWQCPGCKAWARTRPGTDFRVLLQDPHFAERPLSGPAKV